MSRIYKILSKYISKYNMFDSMEFIKRSNIQSLQFVKSFNTPLYFYDQYGGVVEKKEISIDNNKYMFQKDEYETLDKDYIFDIIKINSIPDSNGEFKKEDNCAFILIDTNTNTGSLHILSNYKKCISCIDRKIRIQSWIYINQNFINCS